jgi:hypothetical protein
MGATIQTARGTSSNNWVLCLQQHQRVHWACAALQVSSSLWWKVETIVVDSEDEHSTPERKAHAVDKADAISGVGGMRRSRRNHARGACMNVQRCLCGSEPTPDLCHQECGLCRDACRVCNQTRWQKDDRNPYHAFNQAVWHSIHKKIYHAQRRSHGKRTTEAYNSQVGQEALQAMLHAYKQESGHIERTMLNWTLHN